MGTSALVLAALELRKYLKMCKKWFKVENGRSVAFAAQETTCTWESVKAVREAYAPGDCEVIVANTAQPEEPEFGNSSLFDGCWLGKVKYSGDLSGVMKQAVHGKPVAVISSDRQSMSSC